MSEAIATTPLKALLRFPFQSPNWRNQWLIGSALIFAGFLVPIVPLVFVYGYSLQVMRQAAQGQDLTLPAWDDWGKLGSDGLRAMLASFIYLLPGTLVSSGGMAVYFFGSFVLPLIISTAENGNSEALALPLMISFFGGLAIMMLSMFLGTLLIFLGAIPLPMATAHLIARDKMGAAFHVREWWALIRANKLGYFIGWVVIAGLALIWYLVIMLAYYTFILCFLIPFLAAPIGFYLSLVSAAIFGQTYRESASLLAAGNQPASS